MSENNAIEERLNGLAEKLRAMLDEKLGEGWKRRKAPAKRMISYLFGITHAYELEEIDEKFACHVIAGRAGLPARTYGPLIRDGQNLAQYVDVKMRDKREELLIRGLHLNEELIRLLQTRVDNHIEEGGGAQYRKRFEENSRELKEKLEELASIVKTLEER